jgi:hypothetical protein
LARRNFGVQGEKLSALIAGRCMITEGRGSCPGLMTQKKKIESLNQINLILALRKE